MASVATAVFLTPSYRYESTVAVPLASPAAFAPPVGRDVTGLGSHRAVVGVDVARVAC